LTNKHHKISPAYSCRNIMLQNIDIILRKNYAVG